MAGMTPRANLPLLSPIKRQAVAMEPHDEGDRYSTKPAVVIG
jgi:hypothetical protein